MIGRFGGPAFVAVVCAVCAGLFAWANGAVGGGAPEASARTAFLPGNAYAGKGALNGIADADCRQWRAGSRDQRMRVVDQLGDFYGTPTRIWDGARMPQGEAYDTIERACSADYAIAFKLYKIYVHALTFRNAPRD
jgi:hypothetical protein